MFLALAAILSGWMGLAVLVVYAFVIGALFEDDWWFRGLLFLALPIAAAVGLGHIGLPSLGVLGIYVGVYFVAGVVWSFFKWVIFCTDLKKLVQEYIAKNPRNTFYGNNQHTTVDWNAMSKDQKGETLWSYLERSKYEQFLDRSEVKSKLNLAPHLSNWRNKAKVFSWIAYWPFSAINYVFDRLIRDLVDWVVESLKGIYNAISKNIMRGLQI